MANSCPPVYPTSTHLWLTQEGYWGQAATTGSIPGSYRSADLQGFVPQVSCEWHIWPGSRILSHKTGNRTASSYSFAFPIPVLSWAEVCTVGQGRTCYLMYSTSTWWEGSSPSFLITNAALVQLDQVHSSSMTIKEQTDFHFQILPQRCRYQRISCWWWI